MKIHLTKYFLLLLVMLATAVKLHAKEKDSVVKSLILYGSEYRASHKTRSFKENSRVIVRSSLVPGENIRGKLVILNDSTIQLDTSVIPISTITKVRKNSVGNKTAGGFFFGAASMTIALGTVLMLTKGVNGVLIGSSLFYASESPLRLGYKLLRGNPERITEGKLLAIETIQK